VNRREFIQALAAASAAAAIPIVARTQAQIVEGVITNFGGVSENCWREVVGEVVTTTYSYDADFTVALGAGPCEVRRIWADGALVYGDGAELQPELSVHESNGLTVADFKHLPLEAFGNRVPVIRAEVITP